MQSHRLLIKILLFLAFIIFCAIYLIREQFDLEVAKKKPFCEIGLPANVKTSLRVNATLVAFGSVCHSPQCFALYKAALLNSPIRIPKIRHILWKTDRVSKYMASQLSTWNKTHPDWKYVLWQDLDLEKFVSKHYTGVLARFKSVREHIMRVDWIRYMILHHFGGVYADLDYQVYLPLDSFLKFPAVVTRETDAQSLMHFGMEAYPPPVFANPAFLMSTPGHPFFLYSTVLVITRSDRDIFGFAGPIALTDLINQYAKEFPLSEDPEGVVIVPPSRNFFGLGRNSLLSTPTAIGSVKINRLRDKCQEMFKKSTSPPKTLVEYCKDVANLDPITDPKEPVYATHDINKTKSAYNQGGSTFFEDDLIDIRQVLPTVLMANAIF